MCLCGVVKAGLRDWNEVLMLGVDGANEGCESRLCRAGNKGFFGESKWSKLPV